MRRWISNTLYGALLPLTTVTILLSAVSLVGIAVLPRQRVVDTLSHHRIYQAVHDTIPGFVRALSGGDRAAADQFAKVLQEQLTPNVYRGTVEHVVAGFYGTPPPSPEPSAPETASFSPFTSVLSLGQGTFSSLLAVFRVIAPISLFLGALELLGVFATGRTLPSRLRRLSIVLLIPSIPATLFAALLIALPPVLIQDTSTQPSAGALAPLSVFLSALLQEAGARLLALFFVILPISLLLLLLSMLLDHLRRSRSVSTASSVKKEGDLTTRCTGYDRV